MPRTHCSSSCKADSNSSSSDGFTYGNPEKQYAPSLQLEPKHLDIKINLDVSTKTALLEVTTKVYCNHPSSQSLVLNGEGFLNLDVKSKDKPITWSYDGSLITVHWTEEWKKGEERSFVTCYKVDHPVSGLNMSYPDAHYPKRPTYAITDHESERARYWLACVDYPNVRTTLRYDITANKEYLTVANGKCTATKTEGEKTTTTYELGYPCPSYLVCWASGLFVEAKEKAGPNGIPISYIAPANVNPEDLSMTFDETIGIMEFLEKKLGVPFPFREYKYYQIVTPFIGGAMENISLTTWDYRFLCNKTWAKDFKVWTDAVNCHEMTHSYFGDSVVCRFFEHTWLKESWAEFMEKVWGEHRFGIDEATYQAHIDGVRYKDETKEYVRAIVERKYNTSWNIFDSHTYPGGAWRLNQLMNILGQNTFWPAVSEYLSTYAKKTVETDDFRKILEQHSGRNLTKYFDQWFYGLGYPKIKVTYEHSPSSQEVKVTLKQTQHLDTSNSSSSNQNSGIQLFDMDITVQLTDEHGKVTRKVASFVNSDSSSVAFSLPSSSAPTTVVIDPDYVWIMDVDYNPGFTILVNTLKSSSNSVFHRIWAATQLLKLGTKAAFASVTEILRNEKFYGVFLEVAKTLQTMPHSPYARQLVLDLLGYVTLPRPRAELIKCCGAPYPELRKYLLGYIDTINKDNSQITYNALANALEALGHHNHAEDLPLLKEAVTKYAAHDGYYPYIATGAIRGLGHMKSKDAHGFLLEHIAYGKLPEYTRITAARSLAECACWQDELTKQATVLGLEKLLSEPFPLLISGTVDGLVTLNSKSSIPKIETAKALVSNQDQHTIHRKVLDLQQKKDEGAVLQLKAELEKLQQRVAELEKKANN